MSATKQNIVILGATSRIAVEAERIFAARGCGFGLAGRDAAALAALKDDLTVRGAGTVETIAADLTDTALCESTLQAFAAKLGSIDVLILAYGLLGEQTEMKSDLAKAENLLKTNFTSAACWLLAAAKIVAPTGCIAVISSVAGDRGRKSNFIYGASKGGLSIFAQGLAHDLAATGPHVVIVKPGQVDTPMTANFKKGGPLWASADVVGRGIVAAIDGRKGPVVYVPWFWRWIMLIIRLVPSPIFHRTNL